MGLMQPASRFSSLPVPLIDSHAQIKIVTTDLAVPPFTKSVKLRQPLTQHVLFERDWATSSNEIGLHRIYAVRENRNAYLRSSP
jgi:hypothetical protein